MTFPRLRVPALALAAAALSVAAACSQPATSSVGARRDRPASPSPSPSPTVPSPSPTARPPLTVQEWMQDGGSRLITSLNNQFLTFDATGDDAGLRASCAAIAANVVDGRAYPAIPDGQAQGYWSTTLTSLDAASKHCLAGVDQHNSRLIKQATGEFGTANTSFHKLYDRLLALAPR